MSAPSEQLQAADVSGPQERAGERLSVQETIVRHHDHLLRVLRRRLRVIEDAADIAQEAYMRMLQYDGSHEIGSPASLLFHIAINVANDQWRTEAARQISELIPIYSMEIAAPQPPLDRQIEASQDLEIVHDAIQDLPPKCRQVFLLSRVDNMTYPQIAAHCGISVKMVEKHISHALAFCMKRVAAGRGDADVGTQPKHKQRTASARERADCR